MSEAMKHSPGPWRIEREGGDRYLIDAAGNKLMSDMAYYPYTPDSDADWLLIADAPALRAEVSRLRTELADAQRELEQARLELQETRTNALMEELHAEATRPASEESRG